MKRAITGIFAAALAMSATAALAQSKPPLKLGGILDMSSLYADITGPGSEMAAKMAAEDFGGEVLGRKIEIIAADHQNKADLSANIARDMLDNQGVEMLFDVAASATALAAGEIAKARNKIVIFNGPGSIRLTNEACGPYTVHYVFDTFGQANVTGLAAVKQGLDTWYFLTADYAFGQDLEKDTTNVVLKSGGKVLGNVRHPLDALHEAFGKRAGVIVHVPVEGFRKQQPLRRFQADAVDVGDEGEQRRHFLAALHQPELGGLLDAVDGVAAGIGQPDHLGFRSLGLQQEGGKVRRVERMPHGAQHLAAGLQDHIAGVLFKILAESVVGG